MIINHTDVALYDQIPSTYLTEIKKMWFNLTGASHSTAFLFGLDILSLQDERFPASTKWAADGAPEAYREDALRASGFVRNQYFNWDAWTDEGDFYAASTGLTRIQNHLTYCNENSLVIAAHGFGWCWDMMWHNPPGGTVDPVFNVHWAGSSVGGPEGDLRWGLDSGDYALTGNTVCMDTYLAAVEQFISYCASNEYTTKVIFTTGPVDEYTGENAYQREVKHNYIRQYVAADNSRILFDYADILAWSNAGEENVQIWVDPELAEHEYQMIHSDNMLDIEGGYEDDGDHIGERGALRLAKAVWVMLAYFAGWDGLSYIPRSSYPRYRKRAVV